MKKLITVPKFGKTVFADGRRQDFDFGNEQLLYLKKKVDYLFIGDSITQLWDLNAYFGDRYFLVNRGVGGHESEYVRRRFAADALQLEPGAVILMVGTNDIAHTEYDYWWKKKGEPAQKVMEKYKKNILGIDGQCRAAGTELIVCSVIPSEIAPPYNRELRWEMTAQMNEFLRGLGRTYVDYHGALTRDGKTLPAELTWDGIHPNAAGYQIMCDTLKKTLHW